KLFAASAGRVIGPGHFGLFDLGDGVQRFSLHYEADLDRGGASVLDIRPLQWKDGWPVAGENLQAGTYQFESVRTGTALELAVEGFPVGGRPVRRGPPPGATPPAAGNQGTPPGIGPGTGPGTGGGIFAGIGRPIPTQEVAEVSQKWPTGNVNIRMGNYMLQAQQKWTIEPAANAGGYLGAPYFKITIAGTTRTLTATEGGELIALPAFTGSPEQLWRFDQLADGSWRISPKAIPNAKEPLALSAVGSSFATLAKFDPKSEKQRWLIKTP
ncbi:MAG TPA: RICIN domain-containing protein, partial [Blastocatellia bacterium]